MKQKIVYACEKCGKNYSTEEEALKCEAAHVDPVGFDYPSYHAPSTTCSDPSVSKYPYSVHIRFADGGMISYHR